MRFRWIALIVALMTLEASFVQAAPPAQAPSDGASSMKALRKAAADRRRRLIVNNDGGEPVDMTRPSREDFLALETNQLANSQVDSLFYCSRTSGFGVFTHFTKIGQIFTSREGRYANNQMPALIDAGIDPLKVVIDFCRQNKMEVFWSMRMNDTHDSSTQDYGPIILRSNKLKVEHPEYLLGTSQKRPKFGGWSAVDYARPEIRELALRYFEEVCRDYDVDGVELDFFRHPVFFRSTSRGERATDEERAAMTELVKRIRAMTDEVGQKRGRPILIAMKTPDSVDYCRAIGLDIEQWMADDLLDLFVPSGYFQLNEWEYSVALGHKHGVKVYPSLDESRVPDELAKAMRVTDLAYRGRAADVWCSGADGVYVFNFPDKYFSLCHELGAPETLAKLDKDYFGSMRGIVNAAGKNLPYGPFQKVETLHPGKPKTVLGGETASARLNVGENLAKVGPVQVTLRLRFRTVNDTADIQVDLNDQKLMTTAKDVWLEASISGDQVRQGANWVKISRSGKAAGKAVWNDLVLEVRHPQPPAPR